MGCCLTLSGISRDCQSNIGGIRRAWMACHDDVSSVTVDNDEITAIAPSTAWRLYEFRKQTGSFSTATTKDDASGTLYFETTIVFQFTRMETAKRLEMKSLAIGDIAVIIEDNNGKYWYFGKDFAVSLSEGTAETGTNFADLNGYNITMMDMSKEPPFEVTEEAMQEIITNA